MGFGFAGKLMRRTGVSERVGPPMRLLLAVIGLMWVLEIVDFLTPYKLDAWGIYPRTMWGLVGIPLSTFLHGGFTHLIANTVPLFVLGLLIALQGLRHWVHVSGMIVLLGGAGVWLIGKSNSLHLGASGLVFGYFGYLILRGVFDRRARSLLLGVVVLLVYGGLIWGVLPTDPHVSWEGHLCGLLAGGIAARSFSPKPG